MRTMADRRIGIEMCPYANYQVKGYSPMPGKESQFYPLKLYLKHGIHVTVNTDNIGISGASISDNYLLLAKLCPGITRLEILELIRNGTEMAFIPGAERNKLLTRFNTAVFKTCVNLK